MRKKKEITDSGNKFPELSKLTEKIIDESQIKNFINIKLMDNPIEELYYIDCKMEKDYSEKFFVSKKAIQVNTYKACVFISNEQISHIKNKWEIDISELVIESVIKEASRSINKHYIERINNFADKTYKSTFTRKDKILSFLYRLFRKTYHKTIKVKTPSHLIALILLEDNRIMQKARKGLNDFVICSLKTGVFLKNHPSFCYFTKLLEGTKKLNPDMIYPIGKIANLTIYVDPSMKFNDNSIIIGKKTNSEDTGLHIGYFPKGSSLNTIKEETGESKIELFMKYVITDIGENPEYMYSKFYYKTKIKI